MAAAAIRLGIALAAFALALAIVRRPVLAAGIAAAIAIALWVVNNAKVRALREPFVFTDFALFSQAVKHPRLYFPFLNVPLALAATAGVAALLYAALAYETPWPAARTAVAAAGCLLAAAAAIGLATPDALRRLTLDATEDVRALGLLPTLWLYWLAERRAARDSPPPSPYAALPALASVARELPDIVVVQSESFFDARALHAAIRPEVLASFDALRARAVCHGRLAMPAWGANTMRSEFAFLSGIEPRALGIDRFNPYRRAAGRRIATLASYLKALGYRTVCVHPHPADFFARDRVFPNLGFDAFVDIGEFAGAPKAGPYIADAAVTEKILDVLGREGRAPVFVFAITMENHGPLHLERPDAADAAALYAAPPPPGMDDLTIYLRHLRNADAMIGALADRLPAARERVLCFFGDHVPSMPAVYDALGFPDGRTDYLIWRSRAPGRGERLDLAVEDLGLELLRRCGFTSVLVPEAALAQG